MKIKMSDKLKTYSTNKNITSVTIYNVELEYSDFNPSVPSVIKGKPKNVDKFMEIATKLLDKYNITYQKPQGAFYIWIDVECEDSTEFAKNLLIKHKVAVAPGNTFGPIGDRYIRISLASPKKSIEEGIHRLATMLGK